LPRQGGAGRRRAAALLLACLLVLVLAPAPVRAQAGGAVIVRVTTAAGEPLGATLVTLLARDSATVDTATTDASGSARFAGLAVATYTVRAERLGHATATRAVAVEAGRTVRAELVLNEVAVGLPGVIVEAARRRARFEEAAGATVAELTQREMKLLPAPGEADVLRSVEVMPGVVSTSDFSSAFNVRGGSADQNLILLDGLPIYNPFHLGGLFSVFNADMVSRAELLAGGFPARYGGRVSSVLTVHSDPGPPGTDVQVGLSILSARVATGTDLPAALLDAAGLGTGRVRLSLRRSYFDQVLRPVFDFPYHLTDVQAFAEAWTPGGGRLTITAYTGRDVLDLAGLDSFPLRVRWTWGNDVIGASWAGTIAHTRTELRAGYTRFDTGIRFPDFDDTDFRGTIGQALLRADVTAPAGALEVGAGLAADRLRYDNFAATGGTVFNEAGDEGWLLGGYAEGRLRAGRWLVEGGLRTDTWAPRSQQAVTVLQPRLAVKRFIGADVAIKAAAGRYAQFAHSLRDEDLPLGIDIWVLTGARAPHTTSDQVQLGIETYAGDWFGAVEAYHRRFRGVTALNAADEPDDPSDDILAGTGLSYGADLQLRREAGRVRPMLAVSWLRAWREFNDAFAASDAPPLRYAPIFDRRLDIDLVVQALLPRGIEGAVRWSVGTGLPYTRPRGAHVYYEYSLVERAWRHRREPSDTLRSAIVLGPRNAERYPLYHRLDVGVRRTWRRSWGTITPHLDVLNVYDRRNVLFYFYQYDRDPPTRSGLSMFPVLPTVGVEARF
jgi:hypothetical protein